VGTSVPPPGFVPPAPLPEPTLEPEPDPERDPLGRRAKLAAAAAAAVAVGVAAFLLLGSGSGGGLGGPVAQAATVSSSTPGYRMRMSLQMSSSSLGAPITATGSAVVDLRHHATSMSIAMNFGDDPQVTQALGGSTMRMRMIMTGGDIYMKLPRIAAAALPASGKQWVELNLDKLAGIPGLSSLENNPTTSDPSEMLQYLRSESDVVLEEGHQMVDGFETTHYQAEVNLDDLVGKLGGAAQQALSKLKQLLPSGDLPIDVWIDSAHLVRRIAMTLNLGLPSGPSVQETVTADLGDYGAQPQQTPPPADQVQDLSGLASSLGG
jgi:hypothetical protein